MNGSKLDILLEEVLHVKGDGGNVVLRPIIFNTVIKDQLYIFNELFHPLVQVALYFLFYAVEPHRMRNNLVVVAYPVLILLHSVHKMLAPFAFNEQAQ